MNYRHGFHAGNFADLLKHAVLTHLLAVLAKGAAPLTVIDTHAGEGVHDLSGADALRTGEAEAGIGVLMADSAAPPAFDRLKAAVAELNDGSLRFYPGSPRLIARVLRERDRLFACETRRDAFEHLRHSLRGPPAALAVREDGWEAARRHAPRAPAPLLILIDPPYEVGDDGARAAACAGAILALNVGAVIAVWAPIKDLAGHDAWLGRLEDAAGGSSVLVAEARLRPLDDPLRMNGCAMVVVNPPHSLAAPAEEAAAWIARTLGEAGAVGRAQFLSGPASQDASRES